MSTAIDSIVEYNTFIAQPEIYDPATSPEERIKRFAEYVTDDFMLYEPVSVPWGGTWGPGPQGLIDFFFAYARISIETNLVITGFADERYYEDGDTVFHEARVLAEAAPGFPDGFSYKLIEKYRVRDGKIAVIDEYYADTATLLAYIASIPA